MFYQMFFHTLQFCLADVRGFPDGIALAGLVVRTTDIWTEISDWRSVALSNCVPPTAA